MPFKRLTENGHTITFTKTIANSIGKILSNVSCSNAYAERFLVIKHRSENIVLNFKSRSTLNYNSIFTENELKNALKHTHLSASGPDGVTYPMIKHS